MCVLGGYMYICVCIGVYVCLCKESDHRIEPNVVRVF